MSSLSNRQIVNSLLTLSGGLTLVSGIFLFFHLKSHAIKGIHEWGSIVFIVACAAHLVLNRKPLLRTIGNRAAWALLAVVLLFGLGMAFSDIETGHGRRPGVEFKTSRG